MTSVVFRAAWYRFRATVRRRWGEYLAVVVLIGLLGGVALGSIAGARRTQASYETYLASTNPYDLAIFTAFANPALGSSVGYNAATDAKILHLPFVRSEDAVVGFNGNLDYVRGVRFHIAPGEKPPSIVGAMGGEYTTQDVAHLVSGRFANPNAPGEAVMNAQAAAEAGLHIGSVVHIALNSDAQEIAMSAPTGPSNLPPVKVATVRIVGIVVFPEDVDLDDYDSLGAANVLLSPALTRQLANCCAYYSTSALKLVGGSAHLGAVEAELSLQGLAIPGVGGYQTHAPAIQAADRAIKPVSVALGAFGALAALSLLIVAVQVIGRQLRRHANETVQLPRARRRSLHDDGRFRDGRDRRGGGRRRRGGRRGDRHVTTVPARAGAPRLPSGRRPRLARAGPGVRDPGARALGRRSPGGLPPRSASSEPGRASGPWARRDDAPRHVGGTPGLGGHRCPLRPRSR